jgi:cell division protein FtsI (penicillin-binding protein 3)
MMLNIKNEVLIRVYIIAAAVVAFAVIASSRLYQISIVQAPKWQARADSLFVKFVDVEADRGNILADDGSLLATSLPFFDVHFDAKSEGLTNEVFFEHVDSLSWLLATYVDQQYTPGAYREWLIQLRQAPDNTRGIRYVPIAKNLPYNKMLQIKDFPMFRLGRHRGGLIIEQTSRRERPFKMLAQRTIGYVREGAMPVGLEGTFDKVLGGSLGQQLMIRVPGDVYIPVNDLAEIEPKAGDDLVTTIDINIQDVTETALLNALRTHDADHGCVVVMEVATGAVRAIANIGKTPEGWWETFNYAVGERVEPGSLFKLASFMALLEDGYIDDVHQKIPTYRGKYTFYKDELVDAVKHNMDSMTIRQAFAHSSNVGTATMIQRHYGEGRRASAFVQHLKDFGLELPTDIEVGGEELPLIKNPADPRSDWSGTTLPWMSIGYELMMTPLQILQFYNAVANDGRMVKPYLVQRVERYGETVRSFKPEVVKRNVASKKTIAKAKELMQAVVEEGTARNIRSDAYAIAGKTGTAQLNYHKFKSRAGIRHQAAFCGFFPAAKPKYSCIVVISEPKQAGYHGADVAAPVFKRIADHCYTLKPGMTPPVNTLPAPKPVAEKMPARQAGRQDELSAAMRWLNLPGFNQARGAEYAVLLPESDTLFIRPRSVVEKRVPAVVGMGLKDAIYLLENRGCKVKIVGVGKVKSQSIAPGTPAANQTVTLFLQ